SDLDLRARPERLHQGCNGAGARADRALRPGLSRADRPEREPDPGGARRLQRQLRRGRHHHRSQPADPGADQAPAGARPVQHRHRRRLHLLRRHASRGRGTWDERLQRGAFSNRALVITSSTSVVPPDVRPVLRHVVREARMRRSFRMAAGADSRPGGLAEPYSLDWSRRIEDALARDLFALHGQRIVDVVSGATLRHELFLRMVDRKRLIPAGEFGSIQEIDGWVVGRAIEVAAAGHPVDLNLSLRSTDRTMLGLIRGELERTGADPSDVVLELSEPQLEAALDTGAEFIRGVD